MFSLEVHLTKTESSCWPELIPGDTRGTRIFTAEQLSEISERLEKFTGDKVVYVCCSVAEIVICAYQIIASSNCSYEFSLCISAIIW